MPKKLIDQFGEEKVRKAIEKMAKEKAKEDANLLVDNALQGNEVIPQALNPQQIPDPSSTIVPNVLSGPIKPEPEQKPNGSPFSASYRAWDAQGNDLAPVSEPLDTPETNWLNKLMFNKQDKGYLPSILKDNSMTQTEQPEQNLQMTQPGSQQTAKPVGRFATPDLQFGENQNTQMQALKAAQEQANQNLLLARLGEAGQTIGEAWKSPGSKVDTSFWQGLQKDANRPVEELDKRVQMEKFDPNSSASRAARELLKAQKIKFTGNPSLADLEKIMPGIDHLIRNRENAENRAFIAAENAKMRQASAKEKATTKDEQITVKRFDDLNKKLVSETGSSRSAFGKMANIIRSSEAIQNLIDMKGGDLNKMDNREIQELARSLDAILAQGQPTISGTAKLVPQTLWGDVKKIEEYLTNQRQGAGQASFLKNMVNTIDREKNLAADQVKKVQSKILSTYNDLEEKDPEKFDMLMKSHGLRPQGTQDQPTQSNKPKPGDIVNVKGKRYRVGSDGDSLEEIK